MKLIRLICAVIFAIIIAGCTEKETQVEVSSVSLNTATIEMVEGETFNLVATILPKDAEYDGVIWASSNASVASVNSGTVTAIKEGSATITASAGGKSATCTVKISAKIVAVKSIILDRTSLSMQVGETEMLTATVNPDNATDKAVTWSSSDVSVATVSDGKITAKKSGEATITAKSGTCVAECKVTVTVSTESVTLDKTTLSLAIGETATLTATVKPDNATDKTISWSSSDPSVVKVDNGKITALKKGTAVVSVIAANFSASCSVTVNKPDNILYYTSSNGNVVKPFDETAFGAKILSNEYSGGMGRIIFDGPVTSIGRNAFYQNKTLKTIDLPETVSSIGDNAFYNCLQLNAINIPESVASIGIAAFKECKSLSEVDLPGKITAIEKETFYSCWNLSNVKIPRKVKSIGNSAFSITNIRTLDLPQGLQTIGERAFSYCKQIIDIVIPGSVTSIGDLAFWQCDSLVSVEIQEGVTVLSLSCFHSCSLLSTVKLPNSINTIDYNAFYDCPVLSNLYLKANMPPEIRNNVFGDNRGMNIWVPRASVDAYKEKWAEFKDNIKAYDF